MGLEEDLAELRALDLRADGSRDVLRRALRRKQGLIVAAAADRVREAALDGFEDLLHQAFPVLCERPVKRDPGCRGKLAVVMALDAANVLDDEVFLQGVALRQLEPAWGAPVDTAGPVRTHCLFALLRLHHPDVGGLVADQLADPVPNVRIEAARAAASLGGSLGAALLRLKVRLGDDDSAALGEALAGLCEADEDVGMRIAGEWLASSDEGTRELAALALGQTRLDAAVPLLRRAAERAVRARERRTFWVALGTLRLEGARDVLLDQLDGPDVDVVLEALAPYRFDRRTLILALDRAPRHLHDKVREALSMD